MLLATIAANKQHTLHNRDNVATTNVNNNTHKQQITQFMHQEPERWKRITDEGLVALLQRLGKSEEDVAAGRQTARAHKELLQITGYNYSPAHVALDPHLRYKCISTLYFDWMHCYCVDGIFPRELNATMDAIKPLISHAGIHDYLQQWQWPKQFPSAKLVFETGAFQASASQILSFVPVWLHLVREVLLPSGRGGAALSSMHACCMVMLMLMRAQRCSGAVTPDALRRAIREHFEKHLEAFGQETWVFKFHMAMHLPDMFQEFGVLLACWVLERKHRVIKRFVINQKNPAGYEMHLMRQLTAQHIADLRKLHLNIGLIDPKDQSASVQRALRERMGLDALAAQMSGGVALGSGAEAWRGDYVLLDESYNFAAGEIWFSLHSGTAASIYWIVYICFRDISSWVLVVRVVCCMVARDTG